MKHGNRLLQQLTTDLEMPGELLPGQSLVELAGENRVLIEHHHGVVEYSRCRIGVGVASGRILVCGQGLELARMTREQLVITGRIDAIQLVRRETP